MTAKKGHGSETAKKATAKAAEEGQKNPRKSSAAQAEIGKKGGKAKTQATSQIRLGRRRLAGFSNKRPRPSP